MATLRKRGPCQFQVLECLQRHPPQTKTFASSHEAQAWIMQIESKMDAGYLKVLHLRPRSDQVVQASLTRLQFSKLLRHGRVATRQFLDGHVLCLVIGQP